VFELLDDAEVIEDYRNMMKNARDNDKKIDSYDDLQ
jgi:hypothetical protein